ncbi:MAG TPA: hypothetical protein VNV85_06025 [Puia sp.]|nr:hypothetical protein [Puia sp.]
MRQSLKSILLIQGFVLTATGIFANHSNYKKITIYPWEDTTTSAKKASSRNLLAERLVSFNGEYTNRAVDLHWNLADQKTRGHFNIERSTDGEHYEKVGEVNAGSASSSAYSFTDNVKPTVARKNDLYYRVQQFEEGSCSYSKVLIVRMYETHSVASISVTPDPTINDIQVNVQLKESSFVVMKITDCNGEEVMKKTAKADDGLNSFRLYGTSKLKPGNYKLEIIVNSNERMVMKLIKS